MSELVTTKSYSVILRLLELWFDVSKIIVRVLVGRLSLEEIV